MNGRRLYEEIGGVDERYLQQAAVYRARRKAPAWRAVLIAAAALMACVVLLSAVSAGVAIGAILDALKQEPDFPSHPNEDMPLLTPLEQMEQTMQTAQAELTAVSADQLGLYDDYAVLIWRERGSDAYYVEHLTVLERDMMLGLMQRKGRTEFTAKSEQPQYDVWLYLGDGMVVSPYLKNSPGNVGRGAVFAYDPELELGDDLAEYIARLIEA